MLVEVGEDQVREGDGPVACVALRGGEDAALACDLMRLADDGRGAVQWVDVASLQAQQFPGPQPAESSEQHETPEPRFDRPGELENGRCGEHGALWSVLDARSPNRARI